MSAYRTGMSDSAAGKTRSDKKLAEITYQGHCEILEGFNNETGYKFDNVIKRDIKKRYLRLLISNQDIYKIKEDNLYGFFMQEVRLIVKVKFFTRLYFEPIYNYLRKVRNRIIGVN